MKTVPSGQIIKLQSLEKLALELDEACKSGSIDTNEIAAAQEKLNTLSEDLIGDETIGSKAYIIYEVQGLIHWVSGEYKKANELIKSASTIKQDTDLFTESATKLAHQLKGVQREDVARKIFLRVVGIAALLALVYFVVIPGLKLFLFVNGIWEKDY